MSKKKKGEKGQAHEVESELSLSSLDYALWQMLFAKADWVAQAVVPYYLH